MISKNSRRLAIITVVLISLLLSGSYSIRSNTMKYETYASDSITEAQFKIVDVVLTDDVELQRENTTILTGTGIFFEVPEPIVTEEIIEVAYEQPAEPISTPTTGDGVLTASKGVNYGPSGKETYYNLDMSGCIATMRSYGNTDEYWVREDGCKMLGPYIMCAANLDMHPRGSLVESSLGTCIVVDTGGFTYVDTTQIDIATTW